ncbi:MAG: imelysin family protein [Lewinella sp.]|uniref:imelysin family protein n=1 Tax=Lewinella sp. TaxID=2004506 RepID=UPI003D6ACC94
MKKFLLFPVLALALFNSCSNDDDVAITKVENSDVIQQYASFVYDAYQAAYNDAASMQTAIDNFVASPTAANLQLAKNAWIAARESYGPTEAFRFANGPIDLIDSEEGPEGLLNSWPLNEAYIDYVEGAPSTGIINDAAGFPDLSKDFLASINGDGGEENVSVGYHAIEFLLWGQDNEAPTELTAGDRPYTDFVDGGTAANQDRRRTYLKNCAALLLDHLQVLLDQWQPNGPYTTTFLAADEEENISTVLTSIATLSKSELAGERIFTAYDNRDQEDEHSCFSDNTHRDIRLNFDGIKQVYLGINGAQIGPSIHDLVEQEDATLAASIIAQLDQAEMAVYGTAVPFDFAISNDSTRPQVLEAVNALRDLGDKFAEASLYWE